MKTGMRASVLTLLFFFVVLMMLTTAGCTTKGQDSDSIDSVAAADTMDTTTISAEDSLVIATPMPKRADELFDDFFFNFYINPKLQKARISFPLTVNEGGTTRQVHRNEWVMEHFFRNEEFYSVIGTSARSLKSANDTTIKHVVVEKLMLRDGAVKQFVFNRVDGQWMMQQINNVSISQHPDASFLQFLYKFTSDDGFQRSALSDKVTYVGPSMNEEDEETRNVTTTLSADQIAANLVLPDNFEGYLSSGIYDIVYGDRSNESGQRVVSFRGIANGSELRYTFKKSGNSWKLTRYEM